MQQADAVAQVPGETDLEAENAFHRVTIDTFGAIATMLRDITPASCASG